MENILQQHLNSSLQHDLPDVSIFTKKCELKLNEPNTPIIQPIIFFHFSVDYLAFLFVLVCIIFLELNEIVFFR